jgi:hypothetical protein
MTDTDCIHHPAFACWLCSDVVPWWREARIKAGLGEEPPNYVAPPLPAFIEYRRPIRTAMNLTREEAALVRMLRKVASDRRVNLSELANATRRQITAALEMTS